MKSMLIAIVIALLVVPPQLQAQAVVSPDIWRTFAARLEPGKTLKVRLVNGQRFKATLLQISDEAMTVQPKTRAPVPPQVVRFADVSSIEVDSERGASMAKAVAVGAAVAAGTFFSLLLWAFAAWGD
jgi:hypothetical protein